MRTIITSISLLIVFVTGYTPSYALCTKSVGDTIEVDLSGYKGGQIQWQFSTDKKNWNDIRGATKEKLIYDITENGYFRAKLNNCNSEYLSDTTFEIKTSSYVKKEIDSIKICRWKDDAGSCISFSFDDNSPTHKKISEIFDQYGFKASFFVTGSGMLVDSLKEMIAKGHEVGNHTYSHKSLISLDSTEIDFQIRESKVMIEKALGIKCVSFTEPYHDNNASERKIVFKYHLFDRDYSAHQPNWQTYSSYNIGIAATMTKFTDYVKSHLNNREYIMICGHILDGTFSTSTPKDSLIQYLNFVKRCTNTGDLWVTTVKQGEQYDDLYSELSLVKEHKGDTLTINFKNYNKEKYKDLEASPISIAIPYTISREYSCLSDSVDVKKLSDKFVFTTDLKRDTKMILILKGLGDLYNFISKQ